MPLSKREWIERGVAIGAIAYTLHKTVLNAEWRQDMVKLFFKSVKRVPGLATVVENEKKKALEQIESFVLKQCNSDGAEKHLKLPEKGLSEAEVMNIMSVMKGKQKSFDAGRSFGGIYNDFEDEKNVALQAYAIFEHTNALWQGVFPALKKFEAEVVSMSVGVMNGDSACCGTMTSGGTESLIMAIKAYRDRAFTEFGVTKPEMIMPTTAHPAIDKGAHYLGVKLRYLPVGEESCRAEVGQLEGMINANTIMIIGSAPSFPHGTMDPIEAMAAIALRHRVPFHVDACLGGFLLPFLKKDGIIKAGFDFTVPGVMSISADLHKYAGCPKGSSVVLYRNKDLRKYQYFSVNNWPGGLYCSPSFGGSRPGGIIAGAYAHMIYKGEQGYMESARKIQQGFDQLVRGLSAINGIYVLGKPDACIVALSSKTLNILQIADVVSEQFGFDVQRLQKPVCVHIAVGERQLPWIAPLVEAFAKAVVIVRDKPQEMPKGGVAAIYGMAATLPDRESLTDIMSSYMDVLLQP